MNEFAPVAQIALGYVWQWVRAPKNVPNWVSWGAFAGVSVLLWVWMTDDAGKQLATSWRAAVCQIVSFILAARGAASSSSELKIAPMTNSK